MRFGEKVILFIFRPIYRTFFERLLWWFFTRLKGFFLSEVIASLSDLTARLERIEQRQTTHKVDGWTRVEERLARMEAANAAEWHAMETLLLTMFRQTEIRSSEPEHNNTVVAPEVAYANNIEPERANVANNIR